MSEDKPILKVDSPEDFPISKRNAYKLELLKMVDNIGFIGVLQLLSEVAGEFSGDKVKEPIALDGTFEFDSNYTTIYSVLNNAKDRMYEHMKEAEMGK